MTSDAPGGNGSTGASGVEALAFGAGATEAQPGRVASQAQWSGSHHDKRGLESASSRTEPQVR